MYYICVWLLDVDKDSITFTYIAQGDKTLSAPVRLVGADHLDRICLASRLRILHITLRHKKLFPSAITY